jgi:hypothetical protein
MLNFEYTKEVFTNTVRLRLLKNGIVHYTFLSNVEIDADAHIENQTALIKFTNNTKSLLLVDSDNLISITEEGRKKMREMECFAPVIVRAVVVKSLVPRLLSNFYIKFYKPIIPTKNFSNYVDAMSFLENYEKLNKNNKQNSLIVG